VRTLFKVGEKQHIATRLMGGILLSYGNQTVAPYSEQFYIGGANSIRAFTVRSLGPGSYTPGKNVKYGYVDQTGDIKFEANVEYRFPVFGELYGATFLDAGNVWLLRKDPSRPGGMLTLKNFAKSIALNTGVGVRYDMEFLVIRLDLGVALHVPYETGKSGYYNIPKFKDGLGLHFAIGYPF
jgi:outer membrane protein assembly factor BamA